MNISSVYISGALLHSVRPCVLYLPRRLHIRVCANKNNNTTPLSISLCCCCCERRRRPSVRLCRRCRVASALFFLRRHLPLLLSIYFSSFCEDWNVFEIVRAVLTLPQPGSSRPPPATPFGKLPFLHLGGARRPDPSIGVCTRFFILLSIITFVQVNGEKARSIINVARR